MRMRGLLMGCVLGVLALPLVLGACADGSGGKANALPTAVPGDIAITFSRPTFRQDEPIGIVISNKGQGTFYVLDGRSSCSIAQLQQYDASKKTWKLVNRCTQPVTAKANLLPPGLNEPVTLAPGNAPGDSLWDSGTYRIALDLSGQPDGQGKITTVYSAGFLVK